MRHWRSRRGWDRLTQPAQRRRVTYAIGLLAIAALALVWYGRQHDSASAVLPPTSLLAPPAPAPAQASGAVAPAAARQSHSLAAGLDLEARQAALRRLEGDPSDAARATLLGALRDDPDPTVRLLVVDLLRQRSLSRGDPEGQIEAALNHAVTDPDENVGEAAIDALAELGSGVSR